MKRAVATIAAVTLLALGLLLAPGELASTASAKPAAGTMSLSVSAAQPRSAALGCTVWCSDGRGMSFVVETEWDCILECERFCKETCWPDYQ